MISLVPAWKRTRSRVFSGRGASASSSSVPSISTEGTSVPARPSTLPRSTAARSTPCRLTAVRWPALEAGTAWPWVCSPRTLACSPPGNTSTRSSTRSRPAISVPVTTVPKPLMVNTRSMGSRAS